MSSRNSEDREVSTWTTVRAKMNNQIRTDDDMDRKSRYALRVGCVGGERLSSGRCACAFLLIRRFVDVTPT